MNTIHRDIYKYTEHVKQLEKRLNNKSLNDNKRECIKNEITRYNDSIKSLKEAVSCI